MAALPAMVLAAPSLVSPTWRDLAYLATAGGIVAIATASASVLAAACLSPTASGAAGDLFSDLGPLVPEPLRAKPWRFALGVASMLAATIIVAGVVAHDPYDAVLRGIAEAAACLAGFAVFGPYLGLRSR